MNTTTRVKNKARGFTLVETLVYISLIGVAISGFINFNMTISASRNKNMAINEVHANALTALEFISYKLRAAQTVVLPGAGTASSNIIFRSSTDGVDQEIKLDNDILYYIEGAGTPMAITSSKINIKTLVFSNKKTADDPDSIRIQMSMEYDNPDNSIEYAYSQDFRANVNLRRQP